MTFDYRLDFKHTDFRKHPELYRVGRGDQGVLLVEPYKSELLPLWRFRTAWQARRTAEELYRAFLDYKAAGDFVGMDMSRKFLQMGYNRARRYASPNPKVSRSRLQHPNDLDWKTGEKIKVAAIFHEAWSWVRNDRTYQRLKEDHLRRYG